MSEWIESLPNPVDPEVIPKVRLFGILGTWMESDVVASTIRNARIQGCERIYLVDNASPDDTVDAAKRDGAILARSFRTDQYDENLRLRHMNDVVAEVSASVGDEHLWWLFLDADEFHHGPCGMTLHAYLQTLDKIFRVVGARFFDHFPSGSPQFAHGRHPLDFQPLCEELAVRMCQNRHRKHPLQRYDKAGPRIECGGGFHLAHCVDTLFEPSQPAFLHHFPYREEQTTRQRLNRLWSKGADGTARLLEFDDATNHMLARFRSIDAVYSQDWNAVENFAALEDPIYGELESPRPVPRVHPRPWSELVEPEHQRVERWS